MTCFQNLLFKFLWCFVLIFSGQIFASTGNVAGSGIREGDRSWEYRSSYQESDVGPSAFTHRAHYQQAIDDTQRYRAIIQQGQRTGSSLELNWIRFEYQWNYQKQKPDSSGGALRFDLQFAEGDNQPHFVRAVWIKDYSAGAWQSRFNLFVGADVGNNARSGLSLAAAAQVSRVVGDYSIGGQYFDDLNTTGRMLSFDQQNHQAGVFVSRKFAAWNIFASYLTALSGRAPDKELRIFFGRSL
jgi:hypothetical protein